MSSREIIAGRAPPGREAAERGSEPAARPPRRDLERFAAFADPADLAHLDHPTAGAARAGVVRTIQRRLGNGYAQRAIRQSAVDRALSDASPGAPLDAHVHADMERRLATPLPPDVAVHADAGAAGLAADLDAAAFTRGRDVYFGAGRYAPRTPAGASLLAHELVHVLQQSAGELAAHAGRLVPPEHPSEARAARAEASPVERQSTPAVAALQRQPLELADPLDPEVARDIPAEIADGVYDALWGPNETEKALKLLRGHSASDRQAIQAAFAAHHDGDALADYLADQLEGADLVRGLALLTSSQEGDLHTELALALYPLVRPNDVMRILELPPHDVREQMELMYDATFGKLGEGTLKRDLGEQLAGWRLEKALAYLDRDLTDADHLYFNTLAIVGTHSDQVVALFRRIWAAEGPKGIGRLEREWKEIVVDKEHWTDDDLPTALWWEMGWEGANWGVIAAMLKAHDDAGIAAQAWAPDDVKKRQDLDLQVAKESFAAATEGGGTKEDEVFRDVAAIRNVHEKRIAAAKADTEQPGEVKTAQAAWDKERDALLGQIPGEMSEGTDDYRRVDMLLHADLDEKGQLLPADELWLAMKAGNGAATDRLVVQIWASGRMNEVNAEAMRDKWVGEGSERRRLRPAYVPFMAVGRLGRYAERVYRLAREDRNDEERGAARLEYEIHEGSLDTVYEFLSTSALSPHWRRKVAAAFADTYLRPGLGTPEDKVQAFLRFVKERYGASTRYWDLRELLWDPLSKPTAVELYERAEGRLKASHGGFANFVLDRFADPDKEKLAVESVERLRYIAWEATDAELATMAQELASAEERKTFRRADVAAAEYGLLKGRIQDVVDEKRQIAEALATAIEVVVGALLTAATGGLAGGPLLAALVSATSGMVARELMLGDEYVLFSEENAETLAKVLSSGAMGAAGGEVAKSLEFLAERLPRMTPALQAATQEVFSQLGSTAVSASLGRGLPTSDDIVEGLTNAAISTAASGVSGVIKANSDKTRRMFAANMLHAAMTAGGRDATTIAVHGMGDDTGPELGKRVVEHQATGMATAVVNTLGEIGAEHMKQRREAKEAARMAGEEEEEEKAPPKEHKQKQKAPPEEEEQKAPPKEEQEAPPTEEEEPPKATVPPAPTVEDEEEPAVPVKPKPKAKAKTQKPGAKKAAEKAAKTEAKRLHVVIDFVENFAQDNVAAHFKDAFATWAKRIRGLIDAREFDQARDEMRAFLKDARKRSPDPGEDFPDVDRLADTLSGPTMQLRDDIQSKRRTIEGKRKVPKISADIDPLGEPQLTVVPLQFADAAEHAAFMKKQAKILAREDWRAYEKLMKATIGDAPPIRREGRNPDTGGSEISLEGSKLEFTKHKQRQFWLDLTDLTAIKLYVPKVTDDAKAQLGRLGAQVQAMLNPPGTLEKNMRKVRIEIIVTNPG